MAEPPPTTSLAPPSAGSSANQPQNTAGRPRHAVWEYFSRGAYDDKCKRFDATCLLCPSEPPYKITSARVHNLVQHVLRCPGSTDEIRQAANLWATRGIDVEMLDHVGDTKQATNKKRRQATLDGQVTVHSKIDEITARQVNTKLLMFLATSNIPFCAVDNQHLLDALHLLRPDFTPAGKVL
jgi:hypothetical protein